MFKKKVCYLTGTRADFGLMTSTLQAIQAHPSFELSIAVTGMHLSEAYGLTIREVEAMGFQIAARIPVDLQQSSGASMARALSATLAGMVDTLEQLQPDVLMLLGDRGEMLAGALAAIHLGIPIAHIHGGERSGTVDEPVRHAISKLSHLHLVATSEARDRLIRLGEDGERVHVCGAPGLDGLTGLATGSREELLRDVGLDPALPTALFVYHPVLQEADSAAQEADAALKALADAGVQVLALMPNADAGSHTVRELLLQRQKQRGMVVNTHLSRPTFVSWMAMCDMLVGNSSSGIIEAASFGTPVINIGTRQFMRERNGNVMDVSGTVEAVRVAIEQALRVGRFPCVNRYGDGQAARRIVEQLLRLQRSPELMGKFNAY